MSNSEKKYLEVVEISTGESIHKIDVTGKSESGIEKTLRGLLRQMDTDKFFVKVPE